MQSAVEVRQAVAAILCFGMSQKKECLHGSGLRRGQPAPGSDIRQQQKKKAPAASVPPGPLVVSGANSRQPFLRFLDSEAQLRSYDDYLT
jgi:hypothetical protein